MRHQNAVSMEGLSRRLRCTVPELRKMADDMIGRQFESGGLESIRGLSTFTVGQRSYLTPALAEMLEQSEENER